MRPLAVSFAVVMALTALAPLDAPAVGVPDPTATAGHDSDPIILTGRDFTTWSARSNFTFKLPLTDLADCAPGIDPSGFGDGLGFLTTPDDCAHNNYVEPELDTQRHAPQEGTPIARLLGYHWDAASGRFEQIPFQVDEVFTRYLDNSASGFAPYSGQDQHTTYAFEREGFRYRDEDPDNPCIAEPESDVMEDPVKGLDDNDELAFMAKDAGPAAPADAVLPDGLDEARAVRIVDPRDPGTTSFVYVMKAAAGGPEAKFDKTNGYVDYERDANADTFEKSESSYDNYGNAPRGKVCDEEGNVVTGEDGKPLIERRRPRDYAWITTDRYRFRYDGRWLMTQIRISDDGGETYGPDVIDRWKARAFAQDPGSETPCCGYEEEDTNWGGSSTLLGELSGPVRTVRETWGADSGTNVIRRETFYRREFQQKTWLRVHPIPPLDGIYAQWDMAAGRMTRFYNPSVPNGVAIDGRNDEVFGNLDDPCNVNYDENDTSEFDQGYRTLSRSLQLCELPYHQSVDLVDPTFTDLNVALGWSETTGPHGTIVDRYSASTKDVSPGGSAQSLLAVPYYRDDSCFDDGTGLDPGPKLNLRSGDEPRETADGDPRRCWTPEDGIPDGGDDFFQGSIGTHGLHILTVAESDNARLQVPLTEIVGDQRLVILAGEQPNVGETYGRGFENPLVAVVEPVAVPSVGEGLNPPPPPPNPPKPDPRPKPDPGSDPAPKPDPEQKPGSKPDPKPKPREHDQKKHRDRHEHTHRHGKGKKKHTHRHSHARAHRRQNGHEHHSKRR